jgi:TM2 domain-containing membrane protein YozV
MGKAGEIRMSEQTYAPHRSRVVAGLLALFFGCLGLHKFYLGYFGAGLMMMGMSLVLGILSFGISAGAMAVIGIVEGVIYLTRTPEDFEMLYVRDRREWF